MVTLGPSVVDFMGHACPVCNDTMTDHGAFMPTWSDAHDNIVCFDCSN